MWPADHSAHPFYYPAILTDVSPHRLQFVRPCHIFPAFSPSQPPASSIPLYPRKASIPAFKTHTAPHDHSQHGALHAGRSISPRCRIYCRTRNIPPCPANSVELRRTPFAIPPFQQHRKWPRPCRHIRLHPQNTRQIRLHQYALLTRYFKISALFLHLQLGAAYGTPKGHGLPAMYERLRKNKICSTPPPQTGAVYCPCGPANTATRRDA